MALTEEQYNELCEVFREEAAEITERIGEHLLSIEGQTDGGELRALLQAAFREAHNLKGSAGSLRFTLTARLAHAVESLLSCLEHLEPREQSDSLDVIHKGLDCVRLAVSKDPNASEDSAVDAAIAALESCAAGLSKLREKGGETRISGLEPFDPPAREMPRTSEPAVAAPPADSDDDYISVEPDANGEQSLKPDEPEPAEPEEAPRAGKGNGAESGAMLRVSARKLNALMSQVAELLMARGRTSNWLQRLRDVITQEERERQRIFALRDRLRQRRQLQGRDQDEDELCMAVEAVLLRQRDSLGRLRELQRSLQSEAMQSGVLAEGIEEDIRRVRMFPLSSVFQPMPRAARALARDLGKQVRVEIIGGDLELDKKVLDELGDPLTHLLRNAIDHGVESPEERVAAGKSPEGLIQLKAEHRGEAMAIHVMDDGRGIDLETIRRTALERGLLSDDEASWASGSQLTELLFHSGFSTRKVAGHISGRGIGMDVVRQRIERLQGSVTIQQRKDGGTAVTVVLPLAIYVIRVLVVESEGQSYAIPIAMVQRVLRVAPEEILDVEGCAALVVDDKPAGLVSLAQLLGRDSPPFKPGQRYPVVMVGTAESAVGLLVDDVISDEEVVVNNFEQPLVRIRYLAGAALLDEGRVILVLNPLDILRTGSSQQASKLRAMDPSSQKVPGSSRPRILLAEDSFITRTMEKSVLESAGFDVRAVSDGAEAWRALAGESFDGVVSDILMPKMTGLELCERIRSEERLRHVPVVLVTSLGTEEDRRRGLRAGADAYLVKTELDHGKLVGKLNELLGRS